MAKSKTDGNVATAPANVTVTVDYYDGEDYDGDDYDDPHYEKPDWVKPSAYIPGTVKNQLREELSEMLRLDWRQAQNVSHKLFKGVRPDGELPNEQTERNHIWQTQTAVGLKKSGINGMTFYSRKDLLGYAQSISQTYEDYEIVGGANGAFFREAMHQAGYVSRDIPGAVFFAPFKTKFADRVLCFKDAEDEPTADFLDVVIRHVPTEPVAATEVPRAFYVGKRRTFSKAERQRVASDKADRKKYRISQAENAKKLQSYRFSLEMGIDPVAAAKELLIKLGAPLARMPTPTSVQLTQHSSHEDGYDENFFDGIDDA